MDLGDKPGCEFLPGRRIVLLLRVVETRPTAAADQVDHTLWASLRLAVELLVEGPLALDMLASPDCFPSSALRGDESKWERSLIVMNMATEHEIHSTCLEDIGEESHVLLVEMFPRRIESRLMHRDEVPGCRLGGVQVSFDPAPELGAAP